jgi:hypothetical protein
MFVIESMPAGKVLFYTGDGWTTDKGRAARYPKPGDAPEVLTIPTIGEARYFQGAYFPPGEEYAWAWLWREPNENH